MRLWLINRNALVVIFKSHIIHKKIDWLVYAKPKAGESLLRYILNFDRDQVGVSRGEWRYASATFCTNVSGIAQYLLKPKGAFC